MVNVDCFISHRCKDYHKEYFIKVLEFFLTEMGLNPVYGCTLEPEFKEILSQNIINGMKRTQIYIAFITPSWKEVMNPIWPKFEWRMWQEIKKHTYSYDCVLGLVYNNSHFKAKRKELNLPGYISELISYQISDENDDYYNTVLAKYKNYEFYINENRRREMKELLSRYIGYFKPRIE